MKPIKTAILLIAVIIFSGAAVAAPPEAESMSFDPSDPVAGEELEITVTASDYDNDLESVILSFDGEEHEKSCSNRVTCETTFEFNPSAGSYEPVVKFVDGGRYYEISEPLSKEIEVEESGPEFSEDPTVSLTSPSDHEEVSTSPRFRFVVTDQDTSSMEDVTLAVEEYDGSGDNPWTYGGVGERAETVDLTYEGQDVPFGPGTIAFKQTFTYEGFNLEDNEQYVWGVKVDDDDGDSPIKSTNRRFNTGEEEPEDKEPTAGFTYSPENPRAGETVYFTSSSTDPDGGIRYTLWDLDDDGEYDDATGRNVDKKFQSKGDYTVSVKVVDYDSNTDTASKTVSVRREKDEDDQKPEIELKHPGNVLGTTDRNEDRRPTFRWKITDDDGEVDDVTLYVEEKHGEPDAPWAWYGKGEKYESYDVSDDTGTQSFRPSSYLEYDREYNWGLKVEDNGETYESTVFTFKTEDERYTPPSNDEPVADLQVTPYSGDEGTKFTFDASGSYDRDGNIQTYKYDFDGDGYYERTSQSSEVTKRIYDVGQKTVRLKVTDNDGASDIDTDSYRVRDVRDEPDPNRKPEISLRNPSDGATGLDSSVTFRWRISDQDDSSMDDVRLVVEEKSYNGDEPWDNGRSIDVSNAVSSTASKTVKLDRDTVYVWGVKANDGDGYHRSSVYDFRTAGTKGGDEDDDEEDAVLEVDVEDRDSDALDAYVDVDGPEHESGRTGSDGEIEFELQEGDYEVDVSKSGYISEYDTVDLDAGEEEEIDFELERRPEDIEVLYTRIPASVCRGDDLTVTTGIRNNGGPTELKLGVSSAYGASNREASVPRYETVERSVTLRSVSGQDSVHVEFDIADGRYGSFSRTVDVLDCESAGDITLDVEPSEIDSGGSVRVSGYLENGREDSVNIRVDGYTRKTVTADRRGYYETNMVMDDVGKRVISARADGAEASDVVTVRPTVNVASVSAPERVFQSEEFEVCGEVRSQIAVQVQLLRDGKIVDSKSGEGNVCFDTETIHTGDQEYGVRAAAYGASSTRTADVEVLESGSEVETFPDKIATVESEDGIVMIDLYNTGDEKATYDISASGMPENWFSTTDKSVTLVKGERKTVYLYTVPEADGSYDVDIQVERDGWDVYSTEVSVEADGTLKPQVTWRERIADLLSLG